MKKAVLLFVGIVFVLSGCAKDIKYISQPSVLVKEQACFQAKLSLLKNGVFFETFRLEITNRTDTALEIDWNKTRYLLNGKDMGTFIFKGIDPEDIKNRTVPPSIIPAKETFFRDVAPGSLVARASISAYGDNVREPGLSPGPVPVGKNTMRLSVECKGRFVVEDLDLVVRAEPQNNK